jgi:hypothetical protein
MEASTKPNQTKSFISGVLYNCGQAGHFKYECKNKKEIRVSNVELKGTSKKPSAINLRVVLWHSICNANIDSGASRHMDPSERTVDPSTPEDASVPDDGKLQTKLERWRRCYKIQKSNGTKFQMQDTLIKPELSMYGVVPAGQRKA